MNKAQHFTLAPDVQFLAVETLPELTRNKFGHTGTDFIITHHNTRKQSKVIAQDAADLLKRFTKPSSWAEAIFQHALDTNRDPQRVAEEAFALLVEMQETGFLIQEKKNLGRQWDLVVGKAFRQYTIKEALRVLDDSGVYRVEDANEKSFALKIFRANEDRLPPLTFQNEKAILQKLDGTVNPRLIDEGQEGAMYFLVLEWCKGETCSKAAAPFRNYNVQDNALAVIDLCLSILEVYSRLHQQGILHGDVHPANILVDENNKIKIIDYGFSALVESSHRTARGGLHFYYEPELTKALLNGEEPPSVTEKGEQYALAVLLYSLLAGEHYLFLSYEPEIAYQQIVNEKPRSFGAFDLNLPPVFDDVFRVALAKSPAHRFASLRDFINAFYDCRAAVLESPTFFIGGKQNTDEKFLRFLTRKYGWESPLLQNGLTVPPTASMNDGAAGIAYLFYRMACVQQDASLLALADVWANRAADHNADYDKSFLHTKVQTPDDEIGRSCLYHSPTGVHMVQTLISCCAGDRYSLCKSIDEYLLAASVSSHKIDLATGQAGLLIGSALLLKELEIIAPHDIVRLTTFTNTVVENLSRTIDSYPAMSVKNPVDYFGIAHGWGGLLYATALWCKVSNSRLPTGFYKRMEELLAQAIKDNNAVRWPLSLNDNTSWPGWCHGHAGYIFLWSLLSELLHDDKLLILADQCATAIHPEAQSAAHLCCGMAGQAYALLKLHRLTGEKKHWTKLQQLKQSILKQLSSAGLRNNSLYKGEVGIGVLLTELQRPELARMPLFE